MKVDDWRKEHLDREREEEAEVLRMVEAGLLFDAATSADIALVHGLADHFPPMVYEAWISGHLPQENLADALWAAWVKNPAPRGLLGERKWLSLFRAAGFIMVRLEIKTDGVPVPTKYEHLTARPTDPVEVWRGALVESKGRGMSWSVHRDCGHDFAQGWANTYNRPSGLFRAVVPPRAVLALFGDWREQEVVVNPNMLRGRVEMVETVSPEMSCDQL
jgi:hypothetical protein